MSLAKWEKRFVRMAYEVASWSKDPSKQVGAVIVSPDRRQVSYGYNGTPKDLEIMDLVLAKVIDDAERTSKNSVTLHAELNAVLNAVPDIAGWTMYVTEPPCLCCAGVILQKRITQIVIPKLSPESNWFKEQLRALKMLQTRVSVVSFDKGEAYGDNS